MTQWNGHRGHQYFCHYHDAEAIWTTTTAPGEQQGLPGQEPRAHGALRSAVQAVQQDGADSPLQPLLSWQTLGGRLAAWPSPSLQGPAEKFRFYDSTGGGNYRQSSRGFQEKRRIDWGSRVKRREKGVVWSQRAHRLHMRQCQAAFNAPLEKCTSLLPSRTSISAWCLLQWGKTRRNDSLVSPGLKIFWQQDSGAGSRNSIRVMISNGQPRLIIFSKRRSSAKFRLGLEEAGAPLWKSTEELLWRSSYLQRPARKCPTATNTQNRLKHSFIRLTNCP